MATTTLETIRLDKWLWAARFYKTRSLSREMVQSGKVKYNGQRAKPSKTVEVGATIRITQGFEEKTIKVLVLSEQRKNATEAQKLYIETQESIEKRQQQSELRKQQALFSPKPETKPDKKQRRQIVRFKTQS